MRPKLHDTLISMDLLVALLARRTKEMLNELEYIDPVGNTNRGLDPNRREAGSKRSLEAMLDEFYLELHTRIAELPLPRREVAIRAGLHPNSLLYLGRPLGSKPYNARVTNFPKVFSARLPTAKRLAATVDEIEKELETKE